MSSEKDNIIFYFCNLSSKESEDFFNALNYKCFLIFFQYNLCIVNLLKGIDYFEHLVLSYKCGLLFYVTLPQSTSYSKLRTKLNQHCRMALFTISSRMACHFVSVFDSILFSPRHQINPHNVLKSRMFCSGLATKIVT